MKKLKSKSKDKTSQKRQYNNSFRSFKSDETQKTIIETYVQMLAKRKGAEVQVDELAKEAKVSERTIFRFFKDKQTLHKATHQYIQQFIQASLTQIKRDDFVGFAKNSFLLFEKHHDLMLAYMFSPYGLQARGIFRKQLNKILIKHLVSQKKLKLNKSLEAKLAVIVSIVNVKLWYDIKTDFNYSAKEISEAVGWALNILVRNIKS